MNNLTKSIASLFILHPVIAFSAVTQITDDNLESYLKNNHPDIYSTAQKNGVDINTIERSDSNINNTNNTTSKDSDDLKPSLPITKPIARILCKRGGSLFLENNFIATCVTKDGTFGNGSDLLGMTFNPAGTGTVNTPDYLRPGSPHEYFSVTLNNQLFTNNNGNSSGGNIPTTIHPLDRYSAVQEGGVLVKSMINERNSQLTMVQKYTVDPNSKEIIIRVEMKNTGETTLNGITYARGLDPDQDRPNTFNTHNKKGHTYNHSFPGQPVHVEPDNIAWASGKNGLSVALYSVDPVTHNTCISSTWTTDPIEILNQDCGLAQQPVYDALNGTFSFDYSDSTINIAFKIGDLAPKETKVFSFKYLFDNQKRRIVPIPMPKPIPLPIDPIIEPPFPIDRAIN